MAAHLEGKGVGVIAWLAPLRRKGGAVIQPHRIANTPDDIHAIRVAAAGADLVLGGDIVGGRHQESARRHQAGQQPGIVNTAEFLPGDFRRNADYSLPTERLKRAIVNAAGAGAAISSTPAAGDGAARQSIAATCSLSYQVGRAPRRSGREGDRDETARRCR